MSYIDAIHSYIEQNKDDPLEVCEFIESLPDYFQLAALYIAGSFINTELNSAYFRPPPFHKNWLARRKFFVLQHKFLKTTPVIPPFLDKKDAVSIKFVACLQSCKKPKQMIPFANQEHIIIYRGICPEELAAYRENGPAALGIWWTRQRNKAKGYAEVNKGFILRGAIKGEDIIIYHEQDNIIKNGDEIRIIPENIPGFNPIVIE